MTIRIRPADLPIHYEIIKYIELLDIALHYNNIADKFYDRDLHRLYEAGITRTALEIDYLTEML